MWWRFLYEDVYFMKGVSSVNARCKVQVKIKLVWSSVKSPSVSLVSSFPPAFNAAWCTLAHRKHAPKILKRHFHFWPVIDLANVIKEKESQRGTQWERERTRRKQKDRWRNLHFLIPALINRSLFGSVLQKEQNFTVTSQSEKHVFHVWLFEILF